MSNFWESSPLYQRKQELHAELQKAREAKETAGELVLSCIAYDADSPRGSIWRERRQAYRDAVEACDAASAAWFYAYQAFEASPVGQAEARYWKDPLAVRHANGPDFYAPAEFVEAAE